MEQKDQLERSQKLKVSIVQLYSVHTLLFTDLSGMVFCFLFCHSVLLHFSLLFLPFDPIRFSIQFLLRQILWKCSLFFGSHCREEQHLHKGQGQ